MTFGVLGEAMERPSDAAEWSIGVDFGTAFSKAAATRVTLDRGTALREISPLRIGAAAQWERQFLTPSAIFLDRKRVHFGPRAAEHLAIVNDEKRELLRSFKMILGAADFERALDYLPPNSVDPDGAFRRRDLIVMYLAYLLSLIDVAAAPRINNEGAMPAIRLRYSRPGWIPERTAAAHEAMTRLFVEANGVRDLIASKLLSRDGLSYDEAHAAIAKARAHPGAFPSLDGGVYEASAVGVCHYSDPTAPNYLVILDIGAGTTDIAGLLRVPVRGNVRVIRSARRTIDIAGDSFDAALMHLVLAKAKMFRSRSDRSALWRSLLPHVRDLKEELFEKGAAKIVFRKSTITCTAKELHANPQFKQALAEIQRLYQKSLMEVVHVGRRDGARRVGVVLAGGGSRLPAIQQMVLKKRWLGPGVSLVRLPTTPTWANQLSSAREFENLFAQLSVAFGAAISGPEQFSSPPI